MYIGSAEGDIADSTMVVMTGGAALGARAARATTRRLGVARCDDDLPRRGGEWSAGRGCFLARPRARRRHRESCEVTIWDPATPSVVRISAVQRQD